jgi:hypothetical protein
VKKYKLNKHYKDKKYQGLYYIDVFLDIFFYIENEARITRRTKIWFDYKNEITKDDLSYKYRKFL